MKSTDMLNPYTLQRKKIKEFKTFDLYQVWGIRGKERKPLYKVCCWKKVV